MAIEAHVSRFKRNNGRLYIIVCLGFAIWLGYDGYYNQNFIAKHSPDNKPDSTLVFNQKTPIFLVGAAVLLGIRQLVTRNKKLIADEKELVFSSGEKIVYDSIQKIDKTNFESKGYFVITYNKENGKEVNRKISDRQYDNLKVVLDHLVAKIT